MPQLWSSERQLPDGQLVSAYTYRDEDGNVDAEVLRWALPELVKK